MRRSIGYHYTELLEMRSATVVGIVQFLVFKRCLNIKIYACYVNHIKHCVFIKCLVSNILELQKSDVMTVLIG